MYSELLPHDTTMAELERRGVKAVILSGGPASVYDDGAPKADPALWSGRIPVLGICYGLQLMALDLGGEVMPSSRRVAESDVPRQQCALQHFLREQEPGAEANAGQRCPPRRPSGARRKQRDRARTLARAGGC